MDLQRKLHAKGIKGLQNDTIPISVRVLNNGFPSFHHRNRPTPYAYGNVSLACSFGTGLSVTRPLLSESGLFIAIPHADIAKEMWIGDTDTGIQGSNLSQRIRVPWRLGISWQHS
ncbi:hypothetical protein Murru_0574 [Allomuricauda ruestringensis DSM 13258]|uniref:Uncharacterized protein n=1 Tax=Allomuricauda ruestringensis (strain DSM 13258 / CIP 107369 / LMG 19739 / B1) TaxID=886377 RepID=G2PS35_ALLRU|nr:hypothetical protein Murru_0574 [Allomuricauda ruestringensis DSM 13258]